MFDDGLLDAVEVALEAFAAQPAALASEAQTCEMLRRLTALQDRVGGLLPGWFDQLQTSGAYESEGAPTAPAWARRELRWDVVQTRAAVAAGATMRILPQVGAAYQAGEIRRDHLDAFTLGVKKAGAEVVAAAEDVMLDVALTCEPAELRAVLKELEEAVHPEGPDRSWLGGMDKHDVSVTRVGDGFHLQGYLDIVTGTRFETWLAAASAPRDADDERTAAQRRLDAVGDLTASVLAHGMPTQRGVQPQLNVLVEAEWLAKAPGAAPPQLAGWGVIGPQLFDYLTCDADRTAILLDGVTGGPTPQAAVLNVGGALRLANRKQRRAVHARQGGRCANPGCGGSVLELHHVVWWEHGGPTDLDNLVGICPRCHQSVHAGRLTVDADGQGGFVFSRHLAGSTLFLDDEHRQTRHRLRQWLRRMRNERDTPTHTRPTPPETAPPETAPPETAPPETEPPEMAPPWDGSPAGTPPDAKVLPSPARPLELAWWQPGMAA
ncbi:MULTISPECIES: HNH endonuclease [Mumia]|nr:MULTISPECIES: HNH endonuclease signature motif containing protein [Mumia]